MVFKQKGIATSKILCTVKTGVNEATKSEVYEADYDGGNPRKLTNLNTLVTCPQSIPKSSNQASKNGMPSFIFIGYLSGQPKLFMSAGNKPPKKILSMRGNQMTPAISKDGEWIAFASDILGTSDLFLVPFNKDVGAMGKPQHLFHAKGAACASPTFSPDGKQIAFAANLDGTPRIYIIDTPEAGAALSMIKPRLLTKKSREATAPVWSPDGTKIAFTGRVGAGPRQIWLYDFETNSEVALTKGAENKENPAWASNSQHLLFNTYGQKSELYLMNILSVHPIKISDAKTANGTAELLFAVFQESES
jgi:TolB protein